MLFRPPSLTVLAAPPLLLDDMLDLDSWDWWYLSRQAWGGAEWQRGKGSVQQREASSSWTWTRGIGGEQSGRGVRGAVVGR